MCVIFKFLAAYSFGVINIETINTFSYICTHFIHFLNSSSEKSSNSTKSSNNRLNLLKSIF